MRIKSTFVLILATIFLANISAPAQAINCYDPQPNQDYSNCSFIGRDLSGRDLTNVRLTNADLTNADLSGADLTGVLSGGIKGVPAALPNDWHLVQGYLMGAGANLNGSVLTNANLTNFNLSNADLTGAAWTSPNLKNVDLTDADLSSANFIGANFQFANLTRANLTNANLSAPNISDADFTDATADGLIARQVTGTAFKLPTDWKMAQGFLIGPQANLSSANLINIDFRQINITGANFNAANIAGSNFNGMDLSVAEFNNTAISQSSIEQTKMSGMPLIGFRGYSLTGTPASLPAGWVLRSGFLIGPKANLSSLDMSHVNFVGTDLTDVSLAAANLSGANLSNVDLRKTIIEDANLTGANINQTNLTGVSLRGIIGPSVTGTPVGLDPDWQYLFGYLIGPGANLSSVDFSNRDLRTAKLKGVNFVAANLTGANLSNVDLTGVNLNGVLLFNTILDGTNLTDAIMSGVASKGIVGTPSHMPTLWRLMSGFIVGPGVNLSTTNLSGFDLRNIDLTGASLAASNLSGADLRGAKLTGASVEGTNFTGAKLLNLVTGNLVGTPTGLPQNFYLEDGSIKITIVLSPTPKVTGLAKVGQKLTANAGKWDAELAITYQWMRNGVNIDGAVQKTYRLAPADFKKGVSVAVTGTGTGGANKTKVSLQALVGAGTMVAKPPKISGVLAKGKTVKVSTSAWVPGAKISYSWLLDGKPIKGATKSSYKILPSQVGKKLSVSVKQVAVGYTTDTKVSATQKIAK